MHLRHAITTIVAACVLSACASSPNAKLEAANIECVKRYPFAQGYASNFAACMGTNDIKYGPAVFGADMDLITKVDAEHAATAAEVDSGQLTAEQGTADWKNQKRECDIERMSRQEANNRAAVVAAQHPAISPP